MAKVRLDTLLAERGLFDSRSRAAASVMAGEVRVGADGRRIDKPGQMVADDVVLAVDEAPQYVSRGGIKLANALDALGVDVEGRRALDVGASTGGFTDVLLQRGAVHVIALDVAYGELHWKLRSDDRVSVVERTNARAIARGLDAGGHLVRGIATARAPEQHERGEEHPSHQPRVTPITAPSAIPDRHNVQARADAQPHGRCDRLNQAPQRAWSRACTAARAVAPTPG